MIYQMLRPIAWVFAKLFFFHKTVGTENVPEQGGCLFACNHTTLLDPVFLGLGVKRRKVHYMAKAELFKNKIFGAFCRSMGAFPVRRGAQDVAAVKTAIDMLVQGHHVGIFPQGKRIKGEKLSRYKTGFALLAVKSGCPIVPVYIKSKDQRPRLFRAVTVVFGRPVTAEELGYVPNHSESFSVMAQNLMTITEVLADSI